MRATIDRMISSGSLSAFSASATNGAVSVRPSQPVRAQSAAPPNLMAGQGNTTQGQSAVRPAPGQILPRGSLLNLSV